jgi:peptidoglycan hydrolase-like protein with peptidoglycan-binding domain
MAQRQASPDACGTFVNRGTFMSTPLFHRTAQVLVASMAAISLLGCASLDSQRVVAEKMEQAKIGPQTAPYRSITSFSSGLRCMDNLLLEYGVRDVAVIVEDLADQTKKINTGTKDMLMSAVSDMTRRSRAVRLVAYGQDSGNTIGFLYQALRRDPYSAIPPFALRGSISQFDDTVVRRNFDAGLNIDKLSLGGASTAQASVVGIDLTMLATSDLTVLPGVGSRNQVILFKNGKGLDGEAQIRKFGINFSLSTATQEGQAQAVRTLVELASIELFGRLAHVPYWACLGATGEDEAVQSEIRDWYEAMSANPNEIIAYFQNQLRTRRIYDGPVDGIVNPQIKEAVARYREAVGLSREPKLTFDFFKAYLIPDHEKLTARVEPVPAAAATSPPNAPAGAGRANATAQATAQVAPLALQLASLDSAQRYASGQPVRLVVKPTRDAYVYCFHQDENQKISRFFPNRFRKDSRVDATQGVQLPGPMRFEIRMNGRAVPETVACFATEQDVMAALPEALNTGDFEPVKAASLEQVREAFVGITHGAMAQEYFHVQPK